MALKASLGSRAFWLRQMRQWHWISAAICLIGMLLFAITLVVLGPEAGLSYAADRDIAALYHSWGKMNWRSAPRRHMPLCWTSVPVPTLVSRRSTHVCKRRNPRGTSKSMTLV